LLWELKKQEGGRGEGQGGRRKKMGRREEDDNKEKE
jgi:hypothetical protein